MGLSKPVAKYAVYRVNNDGRREFWCNAASYTNASLLAGAFRDASTEEELEDGWNYLPFRVS